MNRCSENLLNKKTTERRCRMDFETKEAQKENIPERGLNFKNRRENLFISK